MYGGTGVVTVIYNSIILYGAVRMKNLRSFGLAMAACIMAIVPCFDCWLLSIPFGIWALVVLQKPEVKDAFR
jgi:hypothetical protein